MCQREQRGSQTLRDERAGSGGQRVSQLFFTLESYVRSHCALRCCAPFLLRRVGNKRTLLPCYSHNAQIATAPAPSAAAGARNSALLTDTVELQCLLQPPCKSRVCGSIHSMHTTRGSARMARGPQSSGHSCPLTRQRRTPAAELGSLPSCRTGRASPWAAPRPLPIQAGRPRSPHSDPSAAL